MRSGGRPLGLFRIVGILLGVMLTGWFAAGCGTDDQGATTTLVSPSSSDSSTTTVSSTTSSSTGPSSTSTTGAPTSTVQVWFSSGDGYDCGEVTAVTRAIGSDAEPIRAAFDSLVAGPTAEDEAAGAGSFFSAETAGAVESVILQDGLLTVDFVDFRSLIPNASTSCGSQALRAQLDATAFQFDDVGRVRYKIQGSCDEFGNFLQTECFDSDRSGAQLPVPTNERASGSGCTPPSTDDLPDGRWYGLIDEADDARVAFDLACWFSGTAAIVASAEDGQESPPPNDYYVRNANDRVRTLPIDAAVPVTWYPDGGDPTDVVTVPYGEWRVDRAARSFQFGVWLVVEDGMITSVEEQWVP